jgi:hypothetical protein
MEVEGFHSDFSYKINHFSFGKKQDFASIKNHFQGTDIQHPLDGFGNDIDFYDLQTSKGYEKRPFKMQSSFFIEAVPSTFKSTFGSLFDTEVFQLKASEEVNKKAQDDALVFNYKI